MESILKAKHYQIFLIPIIGLFIGNTTITGEPIYSAMFSIVGFWIFMSYPFLIGYSLQKYIPNNISLNNNLFQINVFIILAAYSVVMILSGGQGLSFSGIEAIPFFYVVYAFLHSLSFPAKSVKTIELGQKAKLGDYLGDFFLIVFIPIGIWFLQPRINRIIVNHETINNDPPTMHNKSCGGM
jgi:hypothetical protein